MFTISTTKSGIEVEPKGLVLFLFLPYKRLMTQQYEMTYGAGSDPKTLIFPAGHFEALPFEVRLMGPWYGCDYVDSKDLKSAQRFEIMRQGYALLLQGAGRIRHAA
jgi:hypothetical protein